MTSHQTVHTLLVQAIKSAGADGLINLYGECACTLDDLAPCDCLSLECQLGYRRTCACGEWFMVSDPSVEADRCEDCKEALYDEDETAY